MKRADYLALFERIRTNGADARLYWTSGPRAGQSEPWDGNASSLPGAPARGYGAQCRVVDGAEAYAEQLMGEPHLVIAGGGHVGKAFAAIAVTLGFRLTLVDERPEFADPATLPGVDQVICGGYDETLAALPDYGNAYYVLVTPGHRQDFESALACLHKPFQYLGMIGSKRKVATVHKRLREAGITDEQIAQLHAPIGLDIGGREPAEIAVSIAAQVIQMRAAHGQASFDPAVQSAIESSDEPSVLATIVGHGGSVPRGAGSRMLVRPHGAIIGSVGGGAIENAAIVNARAMLRDGRETDLANYDLSNSESAGLGMICGGHVRVYFELL